MQVILLEKIRNLGNLGDKVNVKPGFGRNYLIPQGKAVSANAANIAKFEARRAELEKAAAEGLAAAKARAEVLAGIAEIVIAAKAGDEGKLFGSISNRDIANAITAAGCKVAKSEIIMSGLIRQLGEYEAHVQFHSDIRSPVKIKVVPEE